MPALRSAGLQWPASPRTDCADGDGVGHGVGVGAGGLLDGLGSPGGLLPACTHRPVGNSHEEEQLPSHDPPPGSAGSRRCVVCSHMHASEPPRPPALTMSNRRAPAPS